MRGDGWNGLGRGCSTCFYPSSAHALAAARTRPVKTRGCKTELTVRVVFVTAVASVHLLSCRLQSRSERLVVS
jgi:hypothetical protein